jgi:hypothetical protein
VIRHRNCLIILYSLTKYSAIFPEVKGYFELMDETINWLEWFGAARAPSDFDLTINLSFLSSKEFGADCKLDSTMGSWHLF